MSAKIRFPLALAIAMAVYSAATAQDLPSATGVDLSKVPAHAKPGEAIPPDKQPNPGLSDWILYTPPECCGPTGCNGPIGYDIYLRNGASIPVGGGILSDILHSGWMVEAGGRALFFNPANDRAWTVDVGFTNVASTAIGNPPGLPMTILVPRPSNANGDANPVINGQTIDPQFQSPPYPRAAAIPINYGTDPRFPGLTLRSFNRTLASFGLGREWYLNAPANDGCWLWRSGADLGGRWGTAKANFKEIPHRTDIVTGIYAAIHSDIEIPCGACKFQFGFRGEWDFNWMNNILQGNDADISSINLLANTGIRW